MTCKKIIEKYLRDNKFDGLYNDDECGCNLDDFMPCGGGTILECKPGYADGDFIGPDHHASFK